jgi:hypothetical protein
MIGRANNFEDKLLQAAVYIDAGLNKKAVNKKLKRIFKSGLGAQTFIDLRTALAGRGFPSVKGDTKWRPLVEKAASDFMGGRRPVLATQSLKPKPKSFSRAAKRKRLVAKLYLAKTLLSGGSSAADTNRAIKAEFGEEIGNDILTSLHTALRGKAPRNDGKMAKYHDLVLSVATDPKTPIFETGHEPPPLFPAPVDLPVKRYSGVLRRTPKAQEVSPLDEILGAAMRLNSKVSVKMEGNRVVSMEITR